MFDEALADVMWRSGCCAASGQMCLCLALQMTESSLRSFVSITFVSLCPQSCQQRRVSSLPAPHLQPRRLKHTFTRFTDLGSHPPKTSRSFGALWWPSHLCPANQQQAWGERPPDQYSPSKSTFKLTADVFYFDKQERASGSWWWNSSRIS